MVLDRRSAAKSQRPTSALSQARRVLEPPTESSPCPANVVTESPVTLANTVGYGQRHSWLCANETRCSLRQRSSVSLLGRARREPGSRLQHRTRPWNRHPEHSPHRIKKESSTSKSFCCPGLVRFLVLSQIKQLVVGPFRQFLFLSQVTALQPFATH